ncbi:MAG: archaeal proteasome endopeptidase complex subunit alpha [Candidatus ainarchaeum sp.]|nr:archaeal proteasome endopeptidase complex subunit alpha [Candidatus ainarchaeum sp.]
MYPVSPQAYDRAITVFSPDGRLFQVEYAKEAVKRGATAIGVVCGEGVVLVAHKSMASTLLEPEYMRKIFMIDGHIAATASGLVGDARRLVDLSRLESQKHKMTYGEDVTVEAVAKNISDLAQAYTQYGGARPFGVSLLLGGIDSEPKLFEVDPSGALSGYKAAAIGAGKKEAEDFLEKEYKEGAGIDDTVALALRALKRTVDAKLGPENVDVAIISRKGMKFEFLGAAEISKYLSKA